MAALAHIGVGLAAKRVAPKVPVGVLVLAAEALDILFGVFFLTGIEHIGYVPWSHGLFMSAIWSVIATLLVALIYRNYRAGAVIGLLVFSHWVLDFISHPMYFMNDLQPDLPLLFDGSPKVGLGLYKSVVGAMVTDYGLLILGVVIYITYIVKNRSEKNKKTIKS